MGPLACCENPRAALILERGLHRCSACGATWIRIPSTAHWAIARHVTETVQS